MFDILLTSSKDSISTFSIGKQYGDLYLNTNLLSSLIKLFIYLPPTFITLPYAWDNVYSLNNSSTS